MDIQFYFEKLLNSQKFEIFKKENPKAFFCSGFFAIDKNGNDNKQHFDYFSNGEIFSFQIEENCRMIPVENSGEKIPEKIPDNLNFDLKRIEKIVEDKMEKEEMRNKIQKYILSLQRLNNTNYLIGTIFISGMGMIRIKINIDKMKVEDFEKSSFMDFFRVVKKS